MTATTLAEPVLGDDKFQFSIEFLREQAEFYRAHVRRDLDRLSYLVGQEFEILQTRIHANRSRAAAYENMIATRECLAQIARPQ